MENILRNRCDCKSECEYYERAMTPILRGAEEILPILNPCKTEFERKILDALNTFECEYFEEAK